MENFQFYNPTQILLGRGMIQEIGNSIKRNSVNKVLLVAGGGSIKKNGVYEQTIASLQQAGIDWVEAWGVRPNPTLSKVKELISLAKQEQVQGILAVGGGSVIDTAKTIAAGIFMDDPWTLFENRFNDVPALPVFTVLTLSGTGTEFDAGAVITNEAENKKWFFMAISVAPKVSVIDPSVQSSLPWYQTVNGSVDAMSHIMEMYFVGGDNEAVLAQDESYLRTLVSATDRLQADEQDYAARASISWIAALALSGLANAGQPGTDSAPHALEHAISVYYPTVSHGAGLGVVFPAWIEYCAPQHQDIFLRWAHNVWNVDTVEDAVAQFRNRLKKWGHPTTLLELGVDAATIPAIAENAFAFGLPALVQPLSVIEMQEILMRAYK
jgi:alcohol dehydrogenase YqhD (iron-dependent ADH family)